MTPQGPIRTPDSRLRVFISSTLQELAPEREAAREAVSRLRMSPIAFEAGARPHPAKDLYRAYLAQSDVFIGIYWERYGWVAPDMDVSGLEDEYRLAARHPKLIYVKAPAPEREPRLTELLRRIQHEDSVSYKRFASADELRDLIENDLALLLTERFAAADPATAAPARPQRDSVPSPVSRLFGREEELRLILDRLVTDRDRLVTLAGPGGVGKTRLAQEVCTRAREQFPDGVFFASLAAAAQASHVLPQIAIALDVREAGGTPLIDAVADRLDGKRALLVLDNFEQVIDAATVVSELLAGADDAAMLVTSREPLRIGGEHVVTVAPLPLRSDGARAPAVELFVERAHAADSGFALTDANVAAIEEICRRLDGLPLAIELAAARVRTMPPEVMVQRLDAFAMAARGGRDLPERQRTLRDAIAWSYELFDAEERRAFALLGAFSGSASLDAAAAVLDIATPEEVLESLADKSMLVRERGARTGLRFNMLETVRAFARERLRELPEEDDARRRLHEYIRGLVVEAQPDAFSAHSEAWIDLIEEEYANIRDAIEANVGDPTIVGPMMYSLFWFWYRRGRLSEARTWVDGALAVSVPGESRSLVAAAGSLIAMWQGDLDVALEWCQEAYAGLSHSDDIALQGVAPFMLAVVRINRGETAEARRLLVEAIEILSASPAPRDRFFISLSFMHLANVEMNDGSAQAARDALAASLDASRNAGDAWLMASVLNNLGEVARTAGDYAEAADHYQESLALFEQADVPSDVARLLCSLGIVAAHLGETDRARTLIEKSAEMHGRAGNKRGLAECVLASACALAGDAANEPEQGRSGLARRAAVMLAASRARMEEIGAGFWPADQASYEATLAVVRPMLDDATFAAACEEGRERRAEDAGSLGAA